MKAREWLVAAVDDVSVEEEVSVTPRQWPPASTTPTPFRYASRAA